MHTIPRVSVYPVLRLIVSVGVACVAFSLFSEAKASTRWETLEAIHHVENPTNSSKPGKFGELGAYQFRWETWRKYTSRPFTDALDRAKSDEIAVQHYEWIKAGLARNGIEPSVYNIAMAWNAGMTAVINGRVPAVSRNYAERVNNLAEDLHSRMLAINQ